MIAVLLCLVPFSVFADNAKNWYFKSAKDHAQPKVMGGMDLSSHNVLSIGSPNDKVVYLTFDAGYENGNVEKTLDVLKKHDACGAADSSFAILLEHSDKAHIKGCIVCHHNTTLGKLQKL